MPLGCNDNEDMLDLANAASTAADGEREEDGKSIASNDNAMGLCRRMRSAAVEGVPLSTFVPSWFTVSASLFAKERLES